MSSPGWARRSTGGSVACTHEMRVRFPPGPPEKLLSIGCGGKGRRPWRSHKPRNAGSIPASATNSRFVQWKDGGPTNRTRGFDSLTGYQSDGGRRQTVTPTHPSGRRVTAALLPWEQARGGSSPPDPTICRVVATATRPAVNRKDPGSNPGPTANLHLVGTPSWQSGHAPAF